MKLSTNIHSVDDKKQLNCIQKFLYYFPKGFSDKKYLQWERNYKYDAHIEFESQLNKKEFAKLLHNKMYTDIANIITRIESRTNLLFSFEKMALRDAIKMEK